MKNRIKLRTLTLLLCQLLFFPFLGNAQEKNNLQVWHPIYVELCPYEQFMTHVSVTNKKYEFVEVKSIVVQTPKGEILNFQSNIIDLGIIDTSKVGHYIVSVFAKKQVLHSFIDIHLKSVENIDLNLAVRQDSICGNREIFLFANTGIEKTKYQFYNLTSQEEIKSLWYDFENEKNSREVYLNQSSVISVVATLEVCGVPLVLSDTINVEITEPVQWENYQNGVIAVCDSRDSVILKTVNPSNIATNFKWLKDGQIIPNETSEKLNLRHCNNSTILGAYQFIAENKCGITTSPTINVVENYLYVDSMIYNCSDSVFTRSASNFDTYEWFKDGKLIAITESGRILANHLQLNDHSMYYVVGKKNGCVVQSNITSIYRFNVYNFISNFRLETEDMYPTCETNNSIRYKAVFDGYAINPTYRFYDDSLEIKFSAESYVDYVYNRNIRVEMFNENQCMIPSVYVGSTYVSKSIRNDSVFIVSEPLDQVSLQIEAINTTVAGSWYCNAGTLENPYSNPAIITNLVKNDSIWCQYSAVSYDPKCPYVDSLIVSDVLFFSPDKVTGITQILSKNQNSNLYIEGYQNLKNPIIYIYDFKGNLVQKLENELVNDKLNNLPRATYIYKVVSDNFDPINGKILLID